MGEGFFGAMAEAAYRMNSPLTRVMSWVARAVARFKRPRMIYGHYNSGSKTFQKYTRMSDSVVIFEPRKLVLEDHVWIGHFAILDASAGLTIEEGCQVGPLVCIYTHSSHLAIRLYGREFVKIPAQKRLAYNREPVRIGAYSFIGSGAIILPGITIGKGCIVGVGSIVTKSVPDRGVAVGNPARLIGDTAELDNPQLQTELFRSSYYDQNLLSELLRDREG